MQISSLLEDTVVHQHYCTLIWVWFNACGYKRSLIWVSDIAKGVLRLYVSHCPRYTFSKVPHLRNLTSTDNSVSESIEEPLVPCVQRHADKTSEGLNTQLVDFYLWRDPRVGAPMESLMAVADAYLTPVTGCFRMPSEQLITYFYSNASIAQSLPLREQARKTQSDLAGLLCDISDVSTPYLLCTHS